MWKYPRKHLNMNDLKLFTASEGEWRQAKGVGEFWRGPICIFKFDNALEGYLNRRIDPSSRPTATWKGMRRAMDLALALAWECFGQGSELSKEKTIK